MFWLYLYQLRILQNYCNNWNEALTEQTNWNKYQSKVSIERPNQYLDYLVDPIFWRINKLFVLLFGNDMARTGHASYIPAKIEIKD